MKESELKVGDKINYLTMISEPYKKNRKAYAIFKCDCGKEKEIRLSNVIDPKGTKSCGCMKNYLSSLSKHNYKHGLCKERVYKIWHKMRSRCNNPNYPEFYYYGGRGVKVCDEWEHDFMSFYTWAMENGYKDSLSIDRIDVNEGYNPSNCKWSTPEEQGNNKRNNILLTVNGETMTLSRWCKKLNIKYANALARYHRGGSPEHILSLDKEEVK